MKLISISGIDGSGKSTQFKKIKDYLQQNQQKVYHFHGVEFSLANKIDNFLKFNSQKNTPKTAKITASKKGIFLRKLFLLADALRFRLLVKKLSRNGYDYILTDRYFYDQIVNILFLEKKEMPIRAPFWLKKAESIIVIPDNAFYIKVSPLEALSRERNIEQGLDYLKKKFSLYEKGVFRWQFIPIFGEQEPEKVFLKIISFLEKK